MSKMGLVSKETVVLRRWGSDTRKFGLSTEFTLSTPLINQIFVLTLTVGWFSPFIGLVQWAPKTHYAPRCPTKWLWQPFSCSTVHFISIIIFFSYPGTRETRPRQGKLWMLFCILFNRRIFVYTFCLINIYLSLSDDANEIKTLNIERE